MEIALRLNCQSSVVDLRSESTEQAVLEAMFTSLADADLNRERLAANLPGTLAQARAQFDYIAGAVGSNVVPLRTSHAA